MQKVSQMELHSLTIQDIPQWSQLLSICFQQPQEHMQKLIDWLNQLGNIVAYGIWKNNILIAQYACLNRKVSFGEKHLPVGMSMNMAVHPDYRGQGLIKQVSQPVYAKLKAEKFHYGVGFSNAQGIKVDRNSKSYGYHVIGQLQPHLTVTENFGTPTLSVAENLPTCVENFTITHPDKAQFIKSLNYLTQRYQNHPFRRYNFAIWKEHNHIKGIMVYKPVRLWGVPAVALLDIYTSQPQALFKRWSTTLHQHNTRLIHTLLSPQSHLKFVLKSSRISFNTPWTRNPYYLTIKPLIHSFDEKLLEFDNWEILGGDIL